jgi:two-component system sensor histidine kinase TctE
MDAWVRQAVGEDVDLGFDLSSAPMVGDRLLLGEMAANLVDNALRHGRRGGLVTVRCRRDGQRVVLSVEDDGQGIPTEQRQRVMERFYRAPGSAPGGSGLGLAIVREVAERHGGEVDIDTVPAGEGALISVYLPAQTVT